MPYKVGIIFRDGRPVIYDSGDYPACQENALAASDYEGFRARQAAARAQGKYLGIGISNVVEGTGLGPYEGATVRIARNGKVTVFTGATPQGQSHKTTFAQIVADQLSVGIEDVTIVTGDTGTIAWGMGTFAARSAVNAGSASYLAAVEVGKKIKDFASRMMEVSPDDLELRDGHVGVRGVPGMQKSYREIAIHAISAPGMSNLGGLVPGLEYTAYFTPDQSTYSNGTHIAEVEVDIETGEVDIRRYVVFHDCGRVINPLVVEGQVVGGVAHGVGNALFEWMKYDADAQPLTTSFQDYLLPAAPDVPGCKIEHVETPNPLNPLGVKGAGEGGIVGVAGAVANAVAAALRPLNAKITALPLSPPRVWQAIVSAADHASKS
jgi:carbon-monoxide dehydrogenase large subunit